MAYTSIQKLRKIRAKNKGWNKKLAVSLRGTVAWLGRKGPEEFSRNEIRDLQLLREMIGTRLYMNAIAKANGEFLANPAKFQVAGGGYSVELNKKEL